MKPTEFKGIYASEKSFRIDFNYQAIRCRETIRATPTKTRLQEAARKRDQIMYEIDMGMFDYARHFPNSPRAFEFSTNKGSMRRISEAVDLWLKHGSLRWTRSTYRGNLSKVKTHILPNWGHLSLSDFKPIMLKEWMATAIRTLSPKSINYVRDILFEVFKEQVMDEVIAANPIEKVKRLPKQREEVNPFNASEQEKIIKALPDNSARHFYQFAFATGLRTGEQLGLTWQDVDFDKQRIYIRRSVVQGHEAKTKTASSNRTHSLRPDALAVLKLIRQYHPNPTPTERVFLDPRNMKPWKYDGVPRERFWKKALEAAKVPYQCPYTCRHTYASTMLTAGKDPAWLAKQMGHKDWGMIRLIYARWIGD